MLDRRTFLTGLLAAPAIVRAGSLDFVPRGSVLMPEYMTLISAYPSIIEPHGYTWHIAGISAADWEADTIERMHRD